MKEYTIQEVVNEFKLINVKNRKRIFVDQRSYLIGILALKFNLSEHAIANLIDIKRPTINYNKRLPIQFKNDIDYQENVQRFYQMFPYDFNKTYAIKSKRNHKIILNIDHKLNRKLHKLKKLLNHDDIRITMKHLIEKSIKLWEE